MTPVRFEPAALRSRVKHSTTKPLRSQRFLGNIMKRLLHNYLWDLSPKVKGQIMYFLVNASPLISFDIATSNFAGA